MPGSSSSTPPPQGPPGTRHDSVERFCSAQTGRRSEFLLRSGTVDTDNLLALMATVGLLTVGCGSAPEGRVKKVQNQLTAEETADGWILLFDGTSLEAWEDPAQERPPGTAWVIEDGCIKGVDNPRLREDLVSREDYGDFELVFEWRISPGGNSGVKYLVQDRAVLVDGLVNPDAERFEDKVEYELEHRKGNRNSLGPDDRIEEYTIAYEYQIIDNEGHPDAQPGSDRTTGAIYGIAAPSAAVVRPVGEFNHSRIRLQGARVQHWLNGTRVLDVDLDSNETRKKLEARWGRHSTVYRLLVELPRRRAPIALQHHNDEVWFRNLKIRRLD